MSDKQETNARKRLPNRRPSVTCDLKHGTISIGFCPETGRAREVFGGPGHLLGDACVLISIALQFEIEPAQILRTLGTVPVWTGFGKVIDGPASPIGEILAAIISEGAGR